ncbi:transcription factor bHLH7-like isoform X2 [Juglans microcarpa x Juglans regia]|uniref:transcription factor bHLH7-like isoform X2 n=2 Tax=Juglans microcarpa x Juglans regia TaxID=2249226 RepID=UPI001B7E7EB5|nr:transcription factor bHLH7-like isoform X2 [Juglans microcarpa x Juglans regia]
MGKLFLFIRCESIAGGHGLFLLVQEVCAPGNMEEESGTSNDNPLNLVSTNFGGKANEVSHLPEDDPAQNFILSDGKCGNQINALPLAEWIETPRLCHNYVDYLTESSTFFPKASTEDVLESVPSSVGGIHSVPCGVSKIQSDIMYNNFGMAPASKPVGSLHDMDTSKEWFLRPRDEGEPGNKSISKQCQIHVQDSLKNHTSWAQELVGHNDNVSQLDPGIVTTPGFSSKSLRRKGAMATDRNRRLRIAERINALQELLPYSAEGGQASVLDDIIDYIKYLQLQIKDLSRSRLGGESSAEPLIFREGYGHYLSQQMLNEPLEEMVGKLLEENPIAAAQLLESKGLFVMPIDLADGLCQII